MKIYTKTGDDGTTGLLSGARVPKYSLRVDTYGTVDELNSFLGAAIACDIPDRLRPDLMTVSNLLFTLGSDLATPFEPAPKFEVPRIKEENIKYLEKLIDEYTSELPPLKKFILPGGTKAASFLHIARTVCRRAERNATALSNNENIGGFALKFLNRLSDYLFTAARMANYLEGKDDIFADF